MQPPAPNRKNLRWKGFGYTSKGYYFITVNVHDGKHLLGEMVNGEVQSNAAGLMVYDVLQQLPKQYDGTEIACMVIMPNHIHLLLFNGGGHYIPDIMRWFKSLTTSRYMRGVREQGWSPFHKTFWQRNYFDHVVRNQEELNHIVQYIEGNPLRWAAKYGMGITCRDESLCASAGTRDCDNCDRDGCEQGDCERNDIGRTRWYAPTILIVLLLLCMPAWAQVVGIRGDTILDVHGGTPLRTGAEELLSHEYAIFPPLRVAIVGNQTSIVGNTHLVDSLLTEGVNVVKIFCPEHGFRGTAAAGAKVDNSTDPKTGLPIISLYGKNKKPTPEQMKDIDVVIFDLQDVGCRFYTYLSTLHYVMEACAENNIQLVVLDRPNPNGHYVDGPVLDTAHYRSFVGMHPVPVVYGMTIGEYAQMINGEHWLKDGIQCNLSVVPMQGYKRDSVGYELPVPPSPNLRNAHAVALYPSLCLFEGTHVSVGRGTDTPFEVLGLPNEYNLYWCVNTIFTVADSQKVSAYHFKLQDGTQLYGINLEGVVVPAKFDLSYLRLMYWHSRKYNFFLDNNFFEKLAGNGDLRKQIESGMSEEEIRASWQPALDHFKNIRQRYLIYPDTPTPQKR